MMKRTLWLMLCLWVTSCAQHVDGVACVRDADCAENDCFNGVCVMSNIVADETECEDNECDTVAEPLNAVDILLMVDNSGSMAQEQAILSSSIFSLINNLYDKMSERGGVPREQVDVRVGVTVSDMGVSYAGVPYSGVFSAHPVCSDGDGLGNNGLLISEYFDEESAQIAIPVQTEVISCQDNENCPVAWMCAYINENGTGKCVPRYQQTTTECPDVTRFISDEGILVLGDEAEEEYGYQHFVASIACLSNVGTDGCAFEQQLASSTAALSNPAQPSFLRRNALTLIIVATDEDDCSLGTNEWHTLFELGSSSTNIVCMQHPEMMTSVSDIYNQMLAAKEQSVGGNAKDSIMFAAITGVPPGEACQGFGDEISECWDVPLEFGTVAEPDIVKRPDPNGNLAFYQEFSCERFDGDTTITQAYPPIRILSLVEQFGSMGYVYSICNPDWSDAMSSLSERIAQRLF